MKVGDKVRRVEYSTQRSFDEKIGQTGVVESLNGIRCDVILDKTGDRINNNYKSRWEVITKETNMISDLMQQFRLSRKGEPEKTLIKAGVIDENENFTDEGKKLFNAFLLGKFGTEFKKEVVDPLLMEQIKERKADK